MRRKKLSLCVLTVVLVAFCAASTLAADEPAENATGMDAMMEAWMKAGTPGPEHEMLASHAGTWKAEVTSWMEPGAEPMVSEGTFERTMILDGRVLKETYTGDFMGQPFEGLSLTGYDNAKGQYWSIWTDNMSTTLMTSWGTPDGETGAIVYEGSSTDPITGEPHWVKTVVTYPEEGKEAMEMYEKHGDEMVKTMELVSTKQ